MIIFNSEAVTLLILGGCGWVISFSSLHISSQISCPFATWSVVYHPSSCGLPLTKSPSCVNCTLGQTKEQGIILTTVHCGTVLSEWSTLDHSERDTHAACSVCMFNLPLKYLQCFDIWECVFNIVTASQNCFYFDALRTNLPELRLLLLDNLQKPKLNSAVTEKSLNLTHTVIIIINSTQNKYSWCIFST